MIRACELTKRYGDKTAVDGLSFELAPGTVTGFLGPNGAGKSTTMRMILGLDAPTSGSVTVAGRPYAQHPAPMRQLGALLEARSIHPGRSARNHLRALAATHSISNARVDEVLELVGLGEVATKRAGSFSLGMGQRLGIATALLGDPEVLMLDEPVNGLDPEGIRWIRELLHEQAGAGKTVFLSSHLMSEMALVADHLIVVGRGRLLADVSMAEFIRQASSDALTIAAPELDRLVAALLLVRPALDLVALDTTRAKLSGISAELVGTTARDLGVVLHELTPHSASLEEAFMDMTRDELEFAAHPDPAADSAAHSNSSAGVDSDRRG